MERPPVGPCKQARALGLMESFFLVASVFSESQKETPSCLRVGGDMNGRGRQEKVTLEGEREKVCWRVRSNGTGSR